MERNRERWNNTRVDTFNSSCFRLDTLLSTAFNDHRRSLVHVHKHILSKYRLSAHSLSIETGRYHHIDRNNRICSLCNMNILEDEYHFVLVCPFYSTIRDKYIKPYYYNTPSTFKLTQLMSTDSSKHLIKLCKYLTTATMHRSDNIVTWLLLTSNIINITNITHLLLTFVLLKLLYLPFPAMCTLFYLFIYYIYVCLQNVNFLANKTLQIHIALLIQIKNTC